MTAKLYRVVVPVDDLERAASFYRRLLGHGGERFSPSWHCFQLGGAILACHNAAIDGTAAAAAAGPLYVAVDEPLLQLQYRARELGALAVDDEIARLPSGETGLQLRDPFGNHLCLVDSHTMLWSRPRSLASRGAVTGTPSPLLLLAQDFLNAVKGGEFARVQELLILDPELIEVVDRSGVSVLMVAAYKRQERVAAYLMALREQLSVWEAAALGAQAQLRALLDAHPALVNQPAVDGFRPLGLACFFGQTDCAELLVERGADTNVPSHNPLRARPLTSALTQCSEERALGVVHLLLRAGANPNLAQVQGHAPLHLAAGRGFSALVELLLGAGADPELRADNGMSPGDFARRGRHPLVLAQLQRHSATDEYLLT